MADESKLDTRLGALEMKVRVYVLVVWGLGGCVCVGVSQAQAEHLRWQDHPWHVA